MSRAEYITSGVLLFLLLCIAAGVLGYRLGAAEPSTSLSNLLPDEVPADWQHLGEPEEYPAYKLNEKIDGEDIEFLSRGCLGLAWIAYRHKEREDSFISVYIYDMGEKDNARSIYEHRRGPAGPEVKNVQIGDEACIIYGSVFLRDGRYYVQLQAGSDKADVASACEFLARQIVSRIRAENQ